MLKRIPFVLAGLYAVWGFFVFSFGGDFWPLGLYFIIWPLSVGIESLLEVLGPHSRAVPVPTHVWVELNWFAGVLYVGLGTMWIWFWSWVVCHAVSRAKDA